MILSCSFLVSPDARAGLDGLSRRLIGKRYAFVEDSEVVGEKDDEMGEVWSWLKREMCV